MPPELASLYQATTKPPVESTVTTGWNWLPEVWTLTRNWPACGVPSAAKRRPYTPEPLPSPVSERQTTTKLPSAHMSTEGSYWLPAKAVATRKVSPKVPVLALKRRA